jgi:hypothetical protein
MSGEGVYIGPREGVGSAGVLLGRVRCSLDLIRNKTVHEMLG